MVGDGYLLGFGRDADPNTGRTEGLKLSLFDASDLSDPRMVENISISAVNDFGNYMYSAAEFDHHAFTFDARTGNITIPVSQNTEYYLWL